MRVDVVDPSAYTPPYDHALAKALARAGADVRLVTSAFPHGAVPAPDGYEVVEPFYRLADRLGGQAGSRRRLALKLAEHVPEMLAYRRRAAADVVHLQWLTLQPVDVHLLPRVHPLVLTAHDVLPRQPRPGQLAGQRRLYGRVDGMVVHSEHGRRRLLDVAGVDPERVEVIPHGAFIDLRHVPGRLPDELRAAPPEAPVTLCPGLLRPYKGLDVLLEAWGREGLEGELWIVGGARMDIAPLRRRAGARVRIVERFISEEELVGCLRRAQLVVLPYRESEGSGVLASALGLGRPLLLSDVGAFSEVGHRGAAELVAPGDPDALRGALSALLADEARRELLAAAAARAAEGHYSWEASARAHLRLYRRLGVAR